MQLDPLNPSIIIAALIALAGTVYLSTKTAAAKVAAFAVVGLSLVAVLWALRGRDEAPPTIEITSPTPGALVEADQLLWGTWAHLPRGSAIWPVVYAIDIGRHYPQDEAAATQAGGGWEGRAHIGTEEDSGRRFDLLVVLAEAEAQQSFRAYLGQAQAAQSWPGLEALPRGALEFDRVPVVRD